MRKQWGVVLKDILQKPLQPKGLGLSGAAPFQSLPREKPWVTGWNEVGMSLYSEKILNDDSLINHRSAFTGYRYRLNEWNETLSQNIGL